MNTTAIMSAWPEDERDRKRAPARFCGCGSPGFQTGPPLLFDDSNPLHQESPALRGFFASSPGGTRHDRNAPFAAAAA